MKIDINILRKLIPESCTIKGNYQLDFYGIQSVYESEQGEITWLKPGVKGEEDLVNATKAGGIICSPRAFEYFKGDLSSKLFLVDDDPKSIFVSLVDYIAEGKRRKNIKEGIHPTAIVHPDCKMGKNVSIGAYSIVGACTIGDNTTIYDHVRISDDVTIGNHCLIREFCSIGGAGFGYALDENGINKHIPHIGYTIIEDYVNIFPFCNVDRGTLGKTKVGRGTVMDHHVHVSHNTILGENNVIAAGVIFSGGSGIGDNCFLGVNTMFKEKAKAGSNVLTGIGAVIIKDIPDGQIWVGNPARYLRDNNT